LLDNGKYNGPYRNSKQKTKGESFNNGIKHGYEIQY
jgi:hypothetical protein